MEPYQKLENLQEEIKNWPEPQISERSKQILKERYLLKDEKGNVIETPKELFYRVALIIASVDAKYGKTDCSEVVKKFYNLTSQGYFIPNSPTLKGAGLNINLSACYVLPVEDSREGIFNTLRDAVNVQAHGGGTGFNFSNLRPRGSLIKSTNGVSSGPISFIEVYDLTIGKTIAQGGTRQGANMAILNYNHPDIEEFIEVKKEEGKLSNFNISVGITEEFIENVKNNQEYPLINHKGKEIKKVNAKEIFDKIIKNAWQSGDPGIVFLDRINKDNPTPAVGKIESTNPCGEQPLLPYEACNLGSINLRKFVKENQIDYENLKIVVEEAVHFLDNVIDANKYPLDEINDLVKANRKIGLGIMGFADFLSALKIPYGSEKSYKIAEEVMGFINKNAELASEKLAEERGAFPNWNESIYNSESKYFLGNKLKLRNATVTTIAPTGTISNIAGVEGGIEPMFSIAYIRKSVFDKEGKAKFEFKVINSEFEKVAKEEGFYSEDLIKEISKNHGSLKNLKKPENISDEKWDLIKKIFVTSHELTYEQHLKMQAAFQKHIGNAVSKTINLPNNATIEDVEESYLLAYDLGLKGMTIYRDGCKSMQVLSVEKDKKEKRPELIGTTVKQATPHGSAFITLNVRMENPKKPYEVFINIGKGKGDIGAIAEGFGRTISKSFSSGVPLFEIIDQLENIPGETQTGFGEQKILSLPDAIAKGVREAYLKLNKGDKEFLKSNGKNNDSKGHSGNFCPDCRSALILSEGCQKCPCCGFSKC